MKQAIKEKSLSDKMGLLCEYAYKELDIICDLAEFKKNEKALLKKFVKGFLTFSKRCSLSDLPTIEGITRNGLFRQLIASSSTLYPFLDWIRWDLSMTAYIYHELQQTPILDEESPVWKVLLSTTGINISYSSVCNIFDYIQEFRPSDEDLENITVEVPYILESTGEELSYLSRPALHFYSKIDNWSEGIKKEAQRRDFIEFSRIVMLCAPGEKKGLLSLDCDITSEDREDLIAAAEIFAMQYRADYPDKNFLLPETEEPKSQYATHTRVNYDTFNTFASQSLIQRNGEGDFHPIEVVNYLTQQESEKKNEGDIQSQPIELDLNGEAKAVAAMLRLAAGRHNLTPKDTRGTTFETTFYKLYKLVSKETEPKDEDIIRFIGGIMALSRPRLGNVKGLDEKGKPTERLQQVTLVHLLGNVDLENLRTTIYKKNKEKEAQVTETENGAEVEIDRETLYNQVIRFTLDDVWFIGFRNTVVEKRDGEVKTIFSPTEHKKSLLLPNHVLENGMTNKKLTFLANIKPKGTKSKKGHMTEEDLLSAVFGYESKLLLAKEKDKRENRPENKDPLRDPKTNEVLKTKFMTWEGHTKREITLNKSNHKKQLKKLFDEAVTEGVIVSYNFKEKTKVYEWTLVAIEEERSE